MKAGISLFEAHKRSQQMVEYGFRYIQYNNKGVTDWRMSSKELQKNASACD